LSAAFRWVLLASALLKLALAIHFGELAPRYDETEYVEFGRAIYAEGAEPRLWRAPLYQWFIAGGMALGNGRLVGVRILQVLLSVGTTWLVYRIGRGLRGERVGFAAGTLVAFYPSQVAFSHLFWSETVYGFFAVLAFHRLLATEGRGGAKAAVGAGVALGLASLTRSAGLVLLAASLAWLVLGRGRRGLVLGAVTLATVAAVLAPWSIGASLRAGEPVPVDVNSGFNVWSGNNEYIPSDVQGLWALGLPLENGLDDRFLLYFPDDEWRREVPVRMARAGVTDAQGPDGARWYRTQAMREVRRDPLGVLRRLPKKLAAFWAPDFFLPRHLLRDWYGPTSPALAALLVLLTWAAAAVALVAGPAALAALHPGRFRALAAWWVGTYLLVHGLAYGHSRLHQPLVPVLLLCVCALLFDPDVAPSRRRLLRLGLPVAALVVAAWVSVFPILGGLYVNPGPRHAAMARALATGRELPLPGTKRQLWMLARVEASLGRNEEASRMLERSRHAEEPWSFILRALMTPDRDEAERLLGEALVRQPGLDSAQDLMRRLRTPTSP